MNDSPRWKYLRQVTSISLIIIVWIGGSRTLGPRWPGVPDDPESPGRPCGSDKKHDLNMTPKTYSCSFPLSGVVSRHLDIDGLATIIIVGHCLAALQVSAQHSVQIQMQQECALRRPTCVGTCVRACDKCVHTCLRAIVGPIHIRQLKFTWRNVRCVIL